MGRGGAVAQTADKVQALGTCVGQVEGEQQMLRVRRTGCESKTSWWRSVAHDLDEACPSCDLVRATVGRAEGAAVSNATGRGARGVACVPAGPSRRATSGARVHRLSGFFPSCLVLVRAGYWSCWGVSNGGAGVQGRCQQWAWSQLGGESIGILGCGGGHSGEKKHGCVLGTLCGCAAGVISTGAHAGEVGVGVGVNVHGSRFGGGVGVRRRGGVGRA